MVRYLFFVSSAPSVPVCAVCAIKINLLQCDAFVTDFVNENTYTRLDSKNVSISCVNFRSLKQLRSVWIPLQTPEFIVGVHFKIPNLFFYDHVAIRSISVNQATVFHDASIEKLFSLSFNLLLNGNFYFSKTAK